MYIYIHVYVHCVHYNHVCIYNAYAYLSNVTQTQVYINIHRTHGKPGHKKKMLLCDYSVTVYPHAMSYDYLHVHVYVHVL